MFQNMSNWAYYYWYYSEKNKGEMYNLFLYEYFASYYVLCDREWNELFQFCVGFGVLGGVFLMIVVTYFSTYSKSPRSKIISQPLAWCSCNCQLWRQYDVLLDLLFLMLSKVFQNILHNTELVNRLISLNESSRYFKKHLVTKDHFEIFLKL